MSQLIKPIVPLINWEHPLTKGLIAVFAVSERSGSLLNLVDRTTILSLVNSGAWTTGPIGPQLDCSQANDSGAWNTSPPSSMKPAKQVSLLWQGIPLASPSDNSEIAGMSYTNADTSPWISYNIQSTVPNSGYTLCWNNDGTFDSFNVISNVGYANGIERQFLITIQTGSQIFYENGIPIGSKTSTFTNINYSANAQFGIGIYQNGIGRNAKAKCSLCYVWNRVLSAQEARMLYMNPAQIFVRPRLYQAVNLLVTAPTGYASWASDPISQPIITNDVVMV